MTPDNYPDGKTGAPYNFCGPCLGFVSWSRWKQHFAARHPEKCDRVCACDRPCAFKPGHDGAHACRADRGSCW